MSNDADLMKLYSQRILALASELPHAERLPHPDASCKKRSPLCGSTVTVDLMLQGDQIVALGQDVKACALGQAAASVIGDQIIGLRQETIAIGRDQLQAMLKSHGPVPDAPFNGLEVLLPAREFKNRHASIMLAFEAILGAMEDAKVNG